MSVVSHLELISACLGRQEADEKKASEWWEPTPQDKWLIYNSQKSPAKRVNFVHWVSLGATGMDVCISVHPRSHPREQPSCKHFTFKLLEWTQLRNFHVSGSPWRLIMQQSCVRVSVWVREAGIHSAAAQMLALMDSFLQGNEAKCILTRRALVCRRRCTRSIFPEWSWWPPRYDGHYV